MAYENDLEDIAVPADYNDINDIDGSTIHVDNTTNDETGNSTINVGNTTDAGMKPVKKSSQLNITGPKGGDGLKTPGPKGNMGPKNPHIDLTPMEKDIFHYAKIFSQNSGWTLYGMLRYVTEHADKHYTWIQIALITTRAHNIAFQQTHNSQYFMYHRYLSLDEVVNELQQSVYHFTKTLGPREF